MIRLSLNGKKPATAFRAILPADIDWKPFPAFSRPSVSLSSSGM